MAAKGEPSKKVIDKHAKFLAAWEAAGFPDKFLGSPFKTSA